MPGDTTAGPGAGRFGPLTPGQQGIWIQAELGAGAAYNVPLAFTLSGELDPARLIAAVNTVIARHEVFRTSFDTVDGEVRQTVADPRPTLHELLDFTNRSAELSALLERSWTEPFVLTQGRLVRALLARTGDTEFVLSLTVHHIIVDDWSTELLLAQIAAEYDQHATMGISGQGLIRPGPRPDYLDWVLWRGANPAQSVRTRQLAHWRQRLSGVAEQVDLPTITRDHGRAGPLGARRGRLAARTLAPGLTDRLRELERNLGCTMFTVQLAAWSSLLSVYTGQPDLAVGTPVADRLGPGAQDVVGYCLNTVVLRVPATPALTFREAVGAVQEGFLDALDNSAVSYEEVVQALAAQREDPTAPLFHAWFATGSQRSDPLALPGVHSERIRTPSHTAKFGLALFATEHDGHRELEIEYDSGQFAASTVDAMLRHYENLLETVVRRPDTRLGELDVLSAHDVSTLEEWGRSRTGSGAPMSLSALFTRAATRFPERTALEHGDRRLSYRELCAAVTAAADRLRAGGVRPQDRVGICVARSFRMVVAVLATLEVGGAYVPIDADHPVNRLRHMAEDCGLSLVIVDGTTAAAVEPARVAVLDVESLLTADQVPVLAAVQAGASPSDLPGLDDVAYVTYTSGSTGRPKGIEMSHRATWNIVGWQLAFYDWVTADSRTLQFAPLSFDVSMQEIFTTLGSGGTLVLIDQEQRDAVHSIMGLVDEKRIDRLFMAAPALQEAVASANSEQLAPGRLSTVIAGSEQLIATADLREFFARLPGCRVFNEYGPSETHVATAYELGDDPAGWPAWVPIGSAVGDSGIHVLDAELRRVPVGCVGEIHIAGPGLAHGYTRMPAATAAAFLPNPFAARPGGRMYRTRDLGRYLADGTLEYLGRSDNQVKIRGFRIELEEIATVLDAHDAVAASVVTTTEAGDGKRIAAYWARSPRSTASSADLLAHLADHLPSYMLPWALQEVDSLPLTTNGKVDRRLLPPVRAAAVAAPGHAEDHDEGELDPATAALVEGFKGVLGLDSVGRRDDFFALGGHSLLANRLVWSVKASHGLDLPLRLVFQERTPARIARRLLDTAHPPYPAALPPIRPQAEAARTRIQQLIDEREDGR